MALSIRIARPEDYDALMRLYGQLHPGESYGQSEIEAETFHTILKTEGLTLFVAETPSDLVATCYLNIIPNLTRRVSPYGVLENVVTDEAHRNKGIGKQVVGAALDHAWSKGCYKVMLMTGSRRPSTHNFYEACGFSPDEKFAFLARPPKAPDA